MVEMEVRKVTKGVESNMVAFDFERTPITQIADYIIITASNSGTSDIHFDPRDDGMMVRFRIDGDLQDYTYIPKLYERNLTTRLKLLANMNITETRLPQDGAIKGEFGGKYLDMRVSCLPLNTGEKIVIRILDYSRSLQGIDSLGFNQTNLKKIKRMMGVPNGIILITGATGSGKSTTVYSMLQGLNKPELNVITVEDPIEMNIEGLNQVQVNSEIGMTFAAALRSILRQDPNVILIGEIRDSETAQIAVRASITGHLVLSTIHTNNSLATVERLLDMDVERYLLSTALTGIVSQRLAKQLCMSCRIERETTKYEKKVFKKFMRRDIEKIYDANPKGCDNCRKGYKGRIAIHEVLELDDEIRNAISDPKLKKEDLAAMVYNGKTISMLQDALGKAISGLTSFEEVYRVIEMESDGDDDVSYLTKSLDDDEDETEKVEIATNTLDDEPTTVKKENTTIVEPLNNVQDQTTTNNSVKQQVPTTTENKDNRDVKEILKGQNITIPITTAAPTNQTKNQTTIPSIATTPGATAPIAQKTIPQQTQATLPQVATLTKEEQARQTLQQQNANATQATNKQAQPTTGVTLLTKEQAEAQAIAAKQTYLEKKSIEDEKKIATFLSKPEPSGTVPGLPKKKLIVAAPNITPTAVTSIPTQQKKVINQQATIPVKEEPPKPEVLVKQAPPTAPVSTKVEATIPELNINIKTNENKKLMPALGEDPIISEEETSFDEKNKVEAIDVTKISKSADLKKEKNLSENPLLPTVKEEAKPNNNLVPIIIDSFNPDFDIKLPTQTNIKKEIALDKKEETTTPEITKIINDQPLIINTKEIKLEDVKKATTPPTEIINQTTDKKELTQQVEIKEVVNKEISNSIGDKPTIKIQPTKPTTPVVSTPKVENTKDLPVEKPKQEEIKPVIKIQPTKATTPIVSTPKVENTKDLPVEKPKQEEKKPVIKIQPVKPTTPVVSTPKPAKTTTPIISTKTKPVEKEKQEEVKPLIKIQPEQANAKTSTVNSTNLEKTDNVTKTNPKPSVKTIVKNDNDNNPKEKARIITKPDGTKVLLKQVVKQKIESTPNKDNYKIIVKPDGTRVLMRKVVKKKEETTDNKINNPKESETNTNTLLNTTKKLVKEVEQKPAENMPPKIAITSVSRKNDLDDIETKDDKTIIITDKKGITNETSDKMTFNIPKIQKPTTTPPIEEEKNKTLEKTPTVEEIKHENQESTKENLKSENKSNESKFTINEQKKEEKEIAKVSKTESSIKKPFITEMKPTVPNIIVDKKEKDIEVEKEPKKEEKKPFITEMKKITEMPKINSNTTNKEDKDLENKEKKDISSEKNKIIEEKLKETLIEEEKKSPGNDNNVTKSQEEKKHTFESIKKPAINIFEQDANEKEIKNEVQNKQQITISKENSKVESKGNIENEIDLDFDIDGELTALDED